MRSARATELVKLISPPGPDAYCHPPFASVESGLAQIEAEGPEGLSADLLRDDLEWLARVQRSVEAMSAHWLAELDRREEEAPAHLYSCCTDWLQEKLHLTPNAAYAQVRTARQLEHLPRTMPAFMRGELSGQQVSVICRAMAQLHQTCLDSAEVESELVGAARYMDPRQLHRHWLQLRYAADQEAGLDAEEEQRRRRWLQLEETWGGGYRLEGELDVEGGATLKTALQGLMAGRPEDDERTPTQRRADALVEIARRCLDAGELPEQGGERPHLMLLAELSTLRLEPGSRLAELNWGPLVTGETARRIGCDAAITPVIVDSNGDVLHVGRSSRSVSPRLRKALNLRDRRCQWSGCSMPPQRCEPHHIRHLADGGRTVLPNLRLYCRAHHRLLHPENARYRTGAGIQLSAP